MRGFFIRTSCWLMLTIATAAGQAASQDPEIAQLRRCVAELEKQNQRMLQTHEEVQSRLPGKDPSPAPDAAAPR